MNGGGGRIARDRMQLERDGSGVRQPGDEANTGTQLDSESADGGTHRPQKLGISTAMFRTDQMRNQSLGDHASLRCR